MSSEGNTALGCIDEFPGERRETIATHLSGGVKGTMNWGRSAVRCSWKRVQARTTNRRACLAVLALQKNRVGVYLPAACAYDDVLEHIVAPGTV